MLFQGDRGVPLTRPMRTLLVPGEHGPRPMRVDLALAVASSESWCGRGLPDLFTRVASHLDWIESAVWPEERNNNNSR